MEVELLSLTEMRHYFVDSDIRFERVGGLIKSIIAVQEPSAPMGRDHPTLSDHRASPR
jgi:hypothetical protein